MNNLPFGFEKPQDSPGFLLWQTTMIWKMKIKKALDNYDISHAQFVIMATLMWFEAHSYETNQIIISHQTKLDKMTVSKSLKKLVALGFVNRIEDKKDTRAKNVTLTDKGKDMVNILVPIVEQIDTQFFNHLSQEEEKQLIGVMSKLVNT